MPWTHGNRIKALPESTCTPSELIRDRFEWLQNGHFSDVYDSYHPGARFRQQFPAVSDYLQFAREQGLEHLDLEELAILDEQMRGTIARVLSYQAYRFRGERHYYLEITTMRFIDPDWQVYSTRRVNTGRISNLDSISWEMVERHPEAIVL